jgi:alpha-beta hydrolase superfamily lysophospholipase
VNVREGLNHFTWIVEPDRPEQPTVVLVHGLNNRPETIDPIAYELQQEGFASIRCNLRGHYGPTESKYLASADGWLEDLNLSCKEAIAKSGNGPLFAIGFSLGGAVILNHLLDNPGFQFERIVFLAPAIKLTPTCQAGPLARLIGHLPFSVPSIAPPTHRAFTFTPLRAYKGLFELISRLHRPEALERFRKLEVLLLIDRKDELVSACQTAKWIERSKLESWTIKYLIPAYGISRHRHHLIIDQQCLDLESWEELTASVIGHLNNIA